MADDLDKLIKPLRGSVLRKQVTLKAVLATHQKVAERIFADGQDARGAQIGTYSEGYKKQRRRGVIYSPQKKNVSFPISNKVILQATRQMVNDFDVIVLPDNSYGSGFKNEFNFNKSNWVEKTYNYSKDGIFGLTPSEEKFYREVTDDLVNDLLNG